MQLEKIRPTIERFVTAISHSMRLEVAVFDSDCRLFFCTPVYLKKKGRMVHAPSLREVMENGSVVVNTPGEMPSCIGCRFKTHCPSTIEILCCIRVGTETIGVLAFTSFTKEGQKRISENTSVYLDAITETANLFGGLVVTPGGAWDGGELGASLRPVMEMLDSPVLLTDAHGVILQVNTPADNLLKLCDIAGSSLWQLFPTTAVNRILEGNDLFEKNVSFAGMNAKISTRAIRAGDRLKGFFVRISETMEKLSAETSSYDSIIGDSPQINKIKQMILRIADSPTPILITGETGTGKELIARAIHEKSGRSKYPFVAVNCAGIPDSLFESEMFGYEEGSFTGAKKGGKIGKIEMAQGGTLFLDEIGEMPLFAQPKLLRILQEYELERVGSNKKIHLDIRIIAATNKDLSEMVAEKTFRSDLLYRINVINLHLAPLRTRRMDIIPIAESYLKKLPVNTRLTCITPEAAALLQSFDWPGNIRQLQNVMEYAANLCESEQLSPEDLPESIRGIERKRQVCVESPAGARGRAGAGSNGSLTELLERYGYTLEGKKRIAAELGISLRTLYRRMKSLPGMNEN